MAFTISKCGTALGLCVIVATLAVLLVACTVLPPSPSAAMTPAPAPSGAVVSPSGSPATACRGEQIRATPGSIGSAAGTQYLTVFVELAQGPACTIPSGPMVTIFAADGTDVASATDTDTTPVRLDYVTRYYIAWSADCRPTPTGTLTARIEFSPTITLDMPVGAFGPSSCMNVSGQTLWMYADETASD